MSSDTTLGARLRETRVGNGITQIELALRVECHDQEISRYERDAIVPKHDRLVALANALRVDPGWLLFGEAAA